MTTQQRDARCAAVGFRVSIGGTPYQIIAGPRRVAMRSAGIDFEIRQHNVVMKQLGVQTFMARAIVFEA